MRFKFLVICLIALSTASSAQETIAGSQEPITEFEVIIGGKVYSFKEGEIKTLDTVLTKPSISIKLAENRKFDNGAVAFQYPRHLGFEFQKAEGYKGWTFSGNNMVVMFFEFDAKVPIDDFVDEMVNKFGNNNCRQEKFQKELGHKICDGVKLNVTLVGQQLTLDFYELILKDGKSRFLAFQESLGEEGVSTDEFKKGFKIINATILYN